LSGPLSSTEAVPLKDSGSAAARPDQSQCVRVGGGALNTSRSKASAGMPMSTGEQPKRKSPESSPGFSRFSLVAYYSRSREQPCGSFPCVHGSRFHLFGGCRTVFYCTHIFARYFARVKGFVGCYLILLSLAQSAFCADRPIVRAEAVRTNGWFQLRIDPQPESTLFTVFRSADLRTWQTVAVLHGREFPQPVPPVTFVDPNSNGQTHFYRVTAEPAEPDDDWRNQAFYPDDPFRSEPLSFSKPEVRWIKFAILTNEPTRVYYQNSWKYPFHYDFARARLPRFKNMTSAEFDAVSLHTNGQKVVLGSLLFAPNAEQNETGVQFVGQDPYSAEQIVNWLQIIGSTIAPMDQTRILYVPSYEQAAAAESRRDYFRAHGFELSTVGRWDSGQSPYSSGWAIGLLKYIPADQIEKAYADGTLGPNDILLTDAVPAEIPYVAGIVTLSPSTPNSHVALLAHSYGVPFIYIAGAEAQQRARGYIGKDVIVTAYDGFPSGEIRLLDASAIEQPLREELASLKKPAQINITPKARRGLYIAPVEDLVPADIKFFGGKASNFGFLRRQLPTNSPPGMAISFDLWDDFMAQKLATGLTLRQEIDSRLAKYTYPPNVASLEPDLKMIRDLIEDSTAFTSEQQQQIAQALLGRFDPKKNIRFRSSTNVEDSEEFVGAGLYESHSGCLEDDQDADNNGPSACDPTETKERGVFRAIRKVYASFYNPNAVLERMRHGVDESKVGMAILVHYSNPDAEELANGVATVSYSVQNGPRSYVAKMVSQKGAVSVTNPDGSAQPEIVSVSKSFFAPYTSFIQSSTLLPLGGHVLTWTSDYEAFAEMFAKVADAFETYYPAKRNYILDFEYKKIVPGALLVKQVRQLPNPTSDATVPYLINSPSDWCVFQGEYGNVFANHRLKAGFNLTTKNLKITAANLQQSILGPFSLHYADGAEIKTIDGSPQTFPNWSHIIGKPEAGTISVADQWCLGAKSVRLSTIVPTTVADSQSPIIPSDTLNLVWEGFYPTPLPMIEFGQQGSVTNESVRLVACPQPNDANILVTRSIPAEAGATVNISFYWPKPPSGPSAGYTAPLAAWKETRIEGLTSQPILLHDYFSQTYRPQHHNFSEDFLFEPALEPGISPALISELEAKSIHFIYVQWGGFDGPSSISVADRDWNIRPLSPGKQLKP
jgi:hypothetical protein